MPFIEDIGLRPTIFNDEEDRKGHINLYGMGTIKTRTNDVRDILILVVPHSLHEQEADDDTTDGHDS